MMATSTLTTQSVFADGPGARLRWVMAALLAILAIVTGQLVGVSPAAAAGGFSVAVAADGTGQGTSGGCHITGPGGDNTPTDGVVCTQDTVNYQWAYSIPSNEAVNVTMTQTLPDGLIWQPNNVVLCESGPGYTGTAAISNSGKTLTCVVSFAADVASRSGFFDMYALVQPGVPDGTVMNTSLVYNQGAGDSSDAAEPVTVRSDLQVNLIKSMRQDYDRVRVNVSGAQMGWNNPKGIALSDSPFTFVDDLAGMPSTTTLAINNGDCRLSPQSGFPSTVDDTGTWFCTQPGPGQPITITITGANTSGAGTSVQAEPNSKTVFAGEFQLIVPQSSIPPGGLVVQNQLTSFAPTADGGATQNYDGNWEPGGEPGAVCTPTNDNCASFTLLPYGNGGDYSVIKSISSPGPSYHDSVGNVVYLPGQAFETKISYIGGVTPQANLLVCEKFDPSSQQLTGVPMITQSGGSDPLPPYSIEYGVQPITAGSVESASCGSPGDPTTDGPWFSSIGAAGGAANISSIRVVFSSDVTNTVFDFALPMVNVGDVAGDVVVDWVGSSTSAAPWGNDRFAQYAVTENILTIHLQRNRQLRCGAQRGSSLHDRSHAQCSRYDPHCCHGHRPHRPLLPQPDRRRGNTRQLVTRHHSRRPGRRWHHLFARRWSWGSADVHVTHRARAEPAHHANQLHDRGVAGLPRQLPARQHGCGHGCRKQPDAG